MNTKRRIEWFLLPVVIITAISGCQPLSTPTPTEKPSPTPAEQPSPTPTDQPSPTPTATEDPCGQMPSSELGITWESQPAYVPTGPVPEGAVLRLGKGSVYAMAEAPDGKTIAIATDTGLTVFSIPDLQELWSVSYPMVGGWVWVQADHIRFSQDGSVIKVTKRTGKNLYFAAQDGMVLEPERIPENPENLSFPEPARSRCIPEEYEGSSIFHQAISADGAFAAGSGTYSGLIYVFDNCTCRLLSEFDVGGMVQYLAWLPARPGEYGGALLTVAWLEGALGIWDPWSGQRIRAGALEVGSGLAWSPDGSTLAVGADTLAVLVDVDTMAIADVLGGDITPRFKPYSFNGGYVPAINSIKWLSNDQLVVTGHNGPEDAVVMTWTQQAGAAWYDVPDTGFTFARSPDGQLLASADSDIINLWEVRSGALLWTVELEYPRFCYGFVWSPDGTRLLCICTDDQIFVLDVDTGQPVGVFSQSSYHPSMAWSPGGVYLAINPWGDHYTIVWDIEHDEHYRVEGLDKPRWSPDGQWIAGAWGSAGTVAVWSIQQRSIAHTLVGHSNLVTNVAWSPDGTLLASSSWDNTVIIFDVAEERLVKRLEGHTPSTRGVVSVAWSPDGRLLVSVGGDGTVIIWDVSQIGQ